MSNGPPANPHAPIPARAWAILTGGFLALFCAAGIWHAFGVFFKPLLAEFGLARTGVSLVSSVAIATIAVSQLFVGWVLGKLGASRTIRIGIAAMGLGLFLTGFAPNLALIYLFFSILAAAGYGMTSLAPAGNVIAQWFDRDRGMAMGIAFSGFSAGTLTMTPLIQFLILRLSWRGAFWALGVGLWVLILPLLLWLLRDREPLARAKDPREQPGGVPGAAEDQSIHIPVHAALRSSSFWLLAGSYFACGFTDFLLFFHFPIFAIGFGVPDQTAANILGVAGGISIFGTVAVAWLSDRTGRPLPLFASYAVRALGFLLLMVSRSAVPLYVFMVIYGFVMFSSNPVTSAITREFYGPKSFGTLYGYLIFVHYVGSFFGPLVGGILYDRLGRYDEAFFIGALLLAGASACSVALRGRAPAQQRTGRPAPTGAEA